MDIYEAEILETLVEESMSKRYGEALADLDASVSRQGTMRVFRDLFRETHGPVAKVLADQQRANMAVAWDKGKQTGISIGWDPHPQSNPYQEGVK